MREDPDETLALLADLVGATDERLRELAKRLAAKVFVDIARGARDASRGVGLLRTLAYQPDGGDLDIDASLEGMRVAAHNGGHTVDPDLLRVRGWVHPRTALCLLVDRSGSMEGKPLATAALAAAAVASLAPSDYSVLAFGRDVVVSKGQLSQKPSERVVGDLLSLRGFGTTDLASALVAARSQLDRSGAGRKIAVLLSDCRATVAGNAAAVAAGLDELVIVAPESDCEGAIAFAAGIGAKCLTVSGPSVVAEVLTRALSRSL
ncbi:MAG: VWA domain-containing protein [Actinobacteria bacterium]|nr:VWA domain-containing protein [Actinomycetota bacterium]